MPFNFQPLLVIYTRNPLLKWPRTWGDITVFSRIVSFEKATGSVSSFSTLLLQTWPDTHAHKASISCAAFVLQWKNAATNKKQALKSGAPGDSRWADTVSFFFLVSPLCVAKKLKYAAKKVAQSLGPRWEAARSERPTEPFCTETFPLGFIFLHPGALWFSHQKRHLWPNCGFDERPSSVCCRPRNKTVGCASSPHRTAADLPPISLYWWKCPRSRAKKRALPMVKELCSVIQPQGGGFMHVCWGPAIININSAMWKWTHWKHRKLKWSWPLCFVFCFPIWID